MDLEMVGPLRNIETIVKGRGIRKLARLRKFYGHGRWKMKSFVVCLSNDGCAASLEPRKI